MLAKFQIRMRQFKRQTYEHRAEYSKAADQAKQVIKCKQSRTNRVSIDGHNALHDTKPFTQAGSHDVNPPMITDLSFSTLHRSFPGAFCSELKSSWVHPEHCPQPTRDPCSQAPRTTAAAQLNKSSPPSYLSNSS